LVDVVFSITIFTSASIMLVVLLCCCFLGVVAFYDFCSWLWLVVLLLL
jgi:hypothetical protein